MKYRFKVPPRLNEFQRDFITRTTREQLLSGGAGIGKTEAGVFKLLWYALTYPGCQLLYAASTWQSLLTIFLPVLESKLYQIPQELWEWQKGLRRFKFANGSIIHYRNLESPSGLRSMNLDFALLEEATEIEAIERVLGEIKRGLRHGKAPIALALITNPGLKTHYLYDWFWNKPTPDKWAVSLPASADHLTPEYLALLDSLPPSLRASFFLGEWGFVEGQAFPSLRVGYADHDPNLKWALTFDYGFSPDPMVYLLVGVRPGLIYVADEITLYRKAVSEHREILQDWFNDRSIWAFTGETATGAGEVRALLEGEFKLPHYPTDKSRFEGAAKMADLYKQDRILISPRCVETRKSLEGMRWESVGSGKSDLLGDFDHHYDALRYLIKSDICDVAVQSYDLTIKSVKRQTGELFNNAPIQSVRKLESPHSDFSPGRLPR